MAAEVLHVVDLAHHAVGVDQERPPAGDGCPVVIGPPRGAVRLPYRMVDVGEQAVREALGVGEGLVLLGGVEGDADDRRVGFLELWGSVTEPLPFDRSAGCRCRRVPPEHDPTAGEVSKGDVLAVLIGHGERRGAVSFGDCHVCFSLSGAGVGRLP